jgi:hypothetical protein
MLIPLLLLLLLLLLAAAVVAAVDGDVSITLLSRRQDILMHQDRQCYTFRPPKRSVGVM